jgi:hypothetical protein
MDGGEHDAFNLAPLGQTLVEVSPSIVAAEEEHIVRHAQALIEHQRAQHEVLGEMSRMEIVPPKTVDQPAQESWSSTSNLASSLSLHSLQNNASNPFYNPAMTFDDATQQLLACVRKCALEADKWANSWPESTFRSFARSKKNTIEHFRQSLSWMADFLTRGRRGWNFLNWSIATMSELEQLLVSLECNLERLAKYDGCGWFKRAMLVHIEVLERRFATVYKQKIAVEDWEGKVLERELMAELVKQDAEDDDANVEADQP